MRERAATNPRRLRDFAYYGNLEAFNAILIPALAIYFGWPNNRSEAILLIIANAALIIGLIVGAMYWWAVAARIKRRQAPMARAMRLADAAQLPMMLLTSAALIGCAWQVSGRGMTSSVIVGIVATTLAALEYINYYHIQLQHFDNRADLRKLLQGKGLRRAHLARDLAVFRAGKAASVEP